MATLEETEDMPEVADDLMPIIYESITDGVTALTFIRVCRLWGDIAIRTNSSQSFVSNYKPYVLTLSKKLYNKDLFTNSTQGWPLRFSGLLNAFTANVIRLPWPRVLQAVASCSPLNPNCVVLARTVEGLRACTLCGKLLKICNMRGVVDIIYCGDQFYVLKNDGRVFRVFDINGRTQCQRYGPRLEGKVKYLLDISGKLNVLVIHSRILPFFSFQLFTMDTHEENWIRGSLADHSLLWSSRLKHCKVVSDTRFKNNCSYFLEKKLVGWEVKCIDMKTLLSESVSLTERTDICTCQWIFPDLTKWPTKDLGNPPFTVHVIPPPTF